MKEPNTHTSQSRKLKLLETFAKTGSITDYELKPRFEVNGGGVYFIDIKHDADGQAQEKAPLWLCDKIELIGKGQDESGQQYRIMRYRNELTGQHETTVYPLAEVGTQSGIQRLRGLGLAVGQRRLQTDALAMYLQKDGSKEGWQISGKAGWHAGSYILPSGEVITATGHRQRVIYHGDKSQAAAYQPSGSLEAWQRDIAAHAAGNSRLCLALAAAFAAPLLELVKAESGGFHLYGDSSDGKTTAARVALSVWADPAQSLLTWQGTGLGFNNTATARNDGLLVLDEIGQAAPKVIGNTVYGIMNGINKVQGAKDGGNRHQSRWRVLVLSTGEKTPDSIMQGYAEWNAGQNTRLPSIPANAGQGMGIYDTLHGFDSGAALSEHLAETAANHHGHAGAAFIRLLDKDSPARITERMAAFMQTLPEMHGQARRVAKRFALLAAAIELAAPVTGLAAGVGMAGIRQCFDAWLQRNGLGSYEDARIITQAINFMQQHAYGERFTEWHAGAQTDYTDRQHAGYRKRLDVIGHDEFWVIPAVFQAEICQSFDPAKAIAVLRGIRWLQDGDTGHSTRRRYAYGRFYVFSGAEPPETD